MCFSHRLAKAFCIAAALTVALLTCPSAFAQQADAEFEGWNLEPGVGQAHLVMVARVASISQVTIVEGAKTDVALREYRFQPVRRLKGIFARDQLSMTASDLGLTSEDAASPALKEGEFRLLVLVQQQGLQSYGCVAAAPGATTFAQRVPHLNGPEDPLVGVVETLIQVADSRSRRERSTLLIDRLTDADGLSAIPLLTSLQLRADWAAADDRALAPLARLARHSSTAVRAAALAVLRDVLANRIKPKDSKQLDSVADALRETLGADETRTDIRVAALESLHHLLEINNDIDWARELLIGQLTGAETHAERASAAAALAHIDHRRAIDALHQALARLPLDESPARESIYARAAVRIDRAGAEKVLLTRLKQSIDAQQSLEAEVEPLGRMRSKESLPLLLTAAGQIRVSDADRNQIAQALGRLGDDRAVPVLVRWFGDYQVKESALAALETLDSVATAREVRPLLKKEGHLVYKLRLARLLARHDLNDGYSLATEHLADVGHTASAALVLAALDDPRTTNDLSAILTARPDRRWHGAVLVGLSAIGNVPARKQVLEVLADDRHPLAADAAEAAGLSTDSELLLPLARLVQSRNKQIAKSSLVALRRFLGNVRSSPRGLAAAELASVDWETDEDELPAPAVELPARTRDTLSESVASLVLDAYVDADLRQDALIVARLLRGERYPLLLTDLADQAELEGSQLLALAQSELRRLREK
jgi:hypothetical protein